MNQHGRSSGQTAAPTRSVNTSQNGICDTTIPQFNPLVPLTPIDETIRRFDGAVHVCPDYNF